MDKTIKFEIPTKYLVYGGLAVAAGLAYWYLKSNGYWDQWFSQSGAVVPAGPSNQPQAGAAPSTFAVPGASDSATPWVN